MKSAALCDTMCAASATDVGFDLKIKNTIRITPKSVWSIPKVGRLTPPDQRFGAHHLGEYQPSAEFLKDQAEWKVSDSGHRSEYEGEILSQNFADRHGTIISK